MESKDLIFGRKYFLPNYGKVQLVELPQKDSFYVKICYKIFNGEYFITWANYKKLENWTRLKSL